MFDGTRVVLLLRCGFRLSSLHKHQFYPMCNLTAGLEPRESRHTPLAESLGARVDPGTRKHICLITGCSTCSVNSACFSLLALHLLLCQPHQPWEEKFASWNSWRLRGLLHQAMSSLALFQLLLAMTLPLLELESAFVPTAHSVSSGVRTLGRAAETTAKVSGCEGAQGLGQKDGWREGASLQDTPTPTEASLPAQGEGTVHCLSLSPRKALWHLLLWG